MIKMLLKFYVLLIGCCLQVIAAPLIQTEEQIWKFMSKYGYIRDKDMVDGLPKDEETRQKSIRFFQQMGNLDITGVLDEDGMALMNTPRCGLADMDSELDMLRKKRYALSQFRWANNDLTWKIIRGTNDLPISTIRQVMRDALQIWSNVSALNFEEVDPGADAVINIVFADGDHSRYSGFPDVFEDGRGGVLAHAFFPSNHPIGGDAHFDDAEYFTDPSVTSNPYDGTNLFQVAAHEFGHSLGLNHSQVRDALMYPYYRGYIPNYQLHQDDIDGIRAHYGYEQEVPQTASPPTPVNMDNCISRFAWVTQTDDGSSYFANETHLFRRINNALFPGYPKNIDEEFVGLPTQLDTAVFLQPFTYFFKGDQYWRFWNRILFGGPRSTSDWGSLPSDIDAAFIHDRDGRLFFFKGDKYYITMEHANPINVPYMVHDVPRPLISFGDDISQGIDAAFLYGQTTYFFRDSNFFRVDSLQQVVDGYPQNAARFWLGCDPGAPEVDVGEVTTMTAAHVTTDGTGDAIATVSSSVTVLILTIANVLLRCNF